MRILFGTLLVSFSLMTALGQEQSQWLEGSVSFFSSRNVYVKFASTKEIAIGDSLFTRQEDRYAPALIVDNKSSTSTVCTPISEDLAREVGDRFYARIPIDKPRKEEQPTNTEQEPTEEGPVEEVPIEPATVITPEGQEDQQRPIRRSRRNGRISAASYSNLSDDQELHRMRYAFTYRAAQLENSRFSTDNYIAFRHTLGDWEEVQNNLGRALKIYALSVSYQIDSAAQLTLGRKINPRTSSLGAIDGLQGEKSFGRFVIGGILGSRPDYTDYSLNLQLMQAGVYGSFLSKDVNSYQHTTLGFIEQTNGGHTDRRFAYFQHSSKPTKNLSLFGSFELDLYQRIGEQKSGDLRLTNLFVSARYRLSRQWRLTASYDNRRNIIYYESYQNQIEQLIENETRQGLRFGFTYRPLRLLTLGVNSGWRFQKSDLNLSKNLNCFINISQIPKVKIRASITANFLETNYLNSRTAGLRLARPVIRGKLDANLYYRLVDYHYKTTETQFQQHIAGAGMSWRILNNLSLNLYYEGTRDSRGQTFERFNSRLIQRF